MSAAGSLICTTNVFMAWTPSSAASSASYGAAGRLANTWVVITADHGEDFGEHR